MSIKKCVNGSFVNDVYREYGTDTDTITTLPQTIIGDGQNISAYTIKGNMQQSGTPTPSNPIYPTECGDKTANLLDNANFENGGWDATIGTVPYKISNSKRCRYSTSISLSSNKLFYNFKTFMVNIIQIDQDGVSLGGTGFLTGTGTATLLSDATAFTLIIANADTSTNIDYTDVQAANISIDYGYEIPISFGQGNYTFYLSEPIRKIGDYADTAPSTGTASRVIEKLVLTGEEGVVITSNGSFYISNSLYLRTEGITTVCSHYTTIPNRSSVPTTDKTVCLYIDGSRIYIRDTTYTTTTDFQTYLAQQYANGTPVTIWYVLATPTTESFTAPTIPTSGTAQSFDVDTTLKPSEVSLTWHGWHEHSDKKYSRTAQLWNGVFEQGGIYDAGGINTSSTRVRTYVAVTAGKTYSFSSNKYIKTVYGYNGDWSQAASRVQLIASTTPTVTQYTFTVPTGVTSVGIALCNSDGSSDIVPSDVVNFMFNEGSTALPYHPYYEWVEQ